ncbi:MAG: type III secretion system export apparatus subunit SctS [Paracoccus sp. (in: a-proteobacteria)]|uniref:type III secretion system export apparatus subunit SctS n=1 Tax=Paracoccus sp. TaxID=267 RepID=UPI0026E00FCE|nr:type III secretion system export apparatus subunit SctS [Paracoccus sp. (in: a-proteobacteria)]MDO5621567.1 type III secretion system export apparatus subunit SctS [Paracoccus sp. (in: a-proteobacteria)]
MVLYEALNHALVLVMQLSLPVIIAATAVGLLIGLIQALTQIQDQTLPHAVKLVAVAITIMVLGAALTSQLVGFADDVFSRIAGSGR